MLISFIGILSFAFSLIYLLYYMVKKTKDSQTVFSKKAFYFLFLGGISLFILSSVDHNSLLDELSEANGRNRITIRSNSST